MSRRVKVSVTLATGIKRSELRAVDRLGPIEVLATEGSAHAISRLVVGMPEGWEVKHPIDDFRHTEIVLSIVSAEFRKRGWQVDGITTNLDPRR